MRGGASNKDKLKPKFAVVKDVLPSSFMYVDNNTRNAITITQVMLSTHIQGFRDSHAPCWQLQHVSTSPPKSCSIAGTWIESGRASVDSRVQRASRCSIVSNQLGSS